MTTNDFPSRPYPEDVATITMQDRTLLLVGTAHISRRSTDLVREVIEQERPDTVCIELDEKRFQPAGGKNLELRPRGGSLCHYHRKILLQQKAPQTGIAGHAATA